MAGHGNTHIHTHTHTQGPSCSLYWCLTIPQSFRPCTMQGSCSHTQQLVRQCINVRTSSHTTKGAAHQRASHVNNTSVLCYC